ncbi:hypothetical protein LPJ66_009797 [Kickxella alabastrina]|uniref:Uncharacterized protein n=1 Tax=Kickxella alabastrina TaxID=61397 RepID=A0ACC1I6I3_9FUNG|nr:hypothetical protein LPJ66_009797 [Kickxella alabastrina]
MTDQYDQNAQPLLTLYLVRHGETEVNRRNCVQGKRVDPPLNERGQTQAMYTGKRFKNIAVDWVVTSEALRAKETGAAISKHHINSPVSHFGALNELEFGDLEGTHVTAGYNDLIIRWDVDHNTDLAAPGTQGESPADCERRAMPCMVDIVQQAVAKGRRHVCVVVHSRLIQIVLASMLDGSMATMDAYKQKKAAVNVVDVLRRLDSSMWPFKCVAREVSSITHLPEDVVSRVSSATSLNSRNPKDERIRFETDASGILVLRHL